MDQAQDPDWRSIVTGHLNQFFTGLGAISRRLSMTEWRELELHYAKILKSSVPRGEKETLRGSIHCRFCRPDGHNAR